MIQNLSLENRFRVLIVFIGILLFIPFNGSVHLFDWDEINFAESAREMIMTGDYSTVRINFIPFWEKPPLFIWMQVISMDFFGINEFAARLPNAICGVLTLLILFEIGKKLKNLNFGLIWALAYGASILPFLYFKSGIIDPWFNLFIFSSLYFAFNHISLREQNLKSFKSAIVSAGILGLAVLTKGPVAILLFGITFLLFLFLEHKLQFLKWIDILVFAVVLILTGGAYHIYQLLSGNWQLVYDFFKYQIRLMKTEDAGHGGSILYHPLVLFVGVFPTSILALNAFFKKSNSNNDYRRLMVILFFVVLVIFSLVKTKIVHYSSLCYFPLSYLAAITVYGICFHGDKLRTLDKVLILIVGFVYALVPGALQIIATSLSPDLLKKFIKDDFVIASIDGSVKWGGYEFIVGIVFGLILIFSIIRLRGIRQTIAIYGGTVVFVFMIMFMVVPKIEKYSQGPAIAFISAFKDKPVWITTLGYYSYAPYFYANKQQRACKDDDEEEFFLHGKTDREVYFVAKVNTMQSIAEQNLPLVEVERKGGFVLFKRIDK